MKNDKKVLIIGGNSSLAIPLVKLFNDHNFEIHATHSKLKDELEAQSNIQVEFELDLTSENSCNLFIAKLKPKSYEYIVALSGITSNKSIDDMNYNEVRKVFEVNVLGLLSILPKLQLSLTENGRICLLGSVAAQGGSFDVVYGASKAALRAAAKAFSLKIPSTQGICVLEPTAIDGSKMFSEMAEEIQEKHRKAGNGKILQVPEVVSCIFALLSSKEPQNGAFAINKESKRCELL